jgi:hypothetical protein
MKSDKLLYHYTSLDAAISIMQSEVLHLKHHQAMNDPTEFFHADELLQKASEQAFSEIFSDGKLITSLKGTQYKRALKVDSKSLIEIMSRLLGNDYYIFSSTQHTDKYDMINGTLVMWRGYAKDGCAIVFDREKLAGIVDSLPKDGKSLSTITEKVIYAKDANDIQRDFKSEYRIFVNYIKNIASSALNPERKALYDEVDGLNPYIKIKSLTKHHAYKSEDEYRMAVLRSMPSIKLPVKNLIRVEKDKKGSDIIKLPIGLHGLPIKQIIVSPFSNQDANFKRLESFIKSTPKCINIRVTRSEIPHS